MAQLEASMSDVVLGDVVEVDSYILDNICFMGILLNSKSHVIFVTCIIDYLAYRHLVYK